MYDYEYELDPPLMERNGPYQKVPLDDYNPMYSDARRDSTGTGQFSQTSRDNIRNNYRSRNNRAENIEMKVRNVFEKCKLEKKKKNCFKIFLWFEQVYLETFLTSSAG